MKNNFAFKILFKLFISFTIITIFGCESFAAQAKTSATLSEMIDNSSITGRVIQFILLITTLSLAPSILIMVTSFVRISIVLSMVRNAIGLQQSPPNQVLVSLALFLTFFIMTPTFEVAYEQGIKPMIEEKINEEEAFPLIVNPFKKFMFVNARSKDIELFSAIAKIPTSDQTMEYIPLQVIIPAFMISELRKAFEIGFLIFLPFLIIDIVVSSILMAMGMLMMPPVMVSLPFKIIFFVLIDGWYLLAGSLVKSFIS